MPTTIRFRDHRACTAAVTAGTAPPTVCLASVIPATYPRSMSAIFTGNLRL